QRFDAFAGMRFEFIEGEFEFPALVVERSNLGSRVGGRVPERGEYPVGAEAAAVDADGADAERGGQLTVLGARRRAGAQFASPGPNRSTMACVRAVGPLRARTIQCRSRSGVASTWKSA